MSRNTVAGGGPPMGTGGFSARRLVFLLATLGSALVLAIAVGLSIGAAPIHPWELFTGKLAGEEYQRAWEILIGLRLPRVLLAAVVGAALSSSGVTFQAILRNPLADPFILGVSGGAALGAILVTALGIDEGTSLGGFAGFIRPLAAFGGAAVTVTVLLLLSRGVRGGGQFSMTPLLLTGVVVNAFFSAMILFIITVVDYTRFQRVFFWLVGAIEPPEPAALAITAGLVAIGIVWLWLLSGRINLLSIGDEEARSLGIDPVRVQRSAILAASLVTAAAVSMAGLIGFVGLMVPHAVRAVIGSDNRTLLPISALAGAIFLVLADTGARTLLAPVEMPVGIITAVCGGPSFLYLFYRGRGAFRAGGGD